MIDEYTRLLEIASESNDERVQHEAVDKLVLHLKSMGRVKLLSGIAQRLRIVQARKERMAPRVEVAHAGESAVALAEAAKEGIVVKHAHVNDSLIKGFRAREGGKLVDRSAKRALIDLYQNLTTI